MGLGRGSGLRDTASSPLNPKDLPHEAQDPHLSLPHPNFPPPPKASTACPPTPSFLLSVQALPL